MTDEADEFAKQVRDGLITAQMVAMSAQYIARELMVDVARLHPEPQRYIRELYERALYHVEKRLPQTGEPEREVNWQTRDILGALFRDAAKALQTPQSPGPRGGVPRGS